MGARPAQPTSIQMLRRFIGGSFALASVAAALLVSATAGAETARIAIISIDTNAASASLSWKVEQGSRISVEYGVDDRLGIWAPISVTPGAATGRTALTGLEPNQTYRYRFVGNSAYGKVESTGTFRTWPWPVSPVSSLSTQRDSGPTPGLQQKPTIGGAPSPTVGQQQKLYALDGAPLFFRMVFRQCPYAFDRSIKAGINMFMGTNIYCVKPKAQLDELATRAVTLLDETELGRVSGPGLAGWHMEDELDARLAKAPTHVPPNNDAGRLTFLTVTDHYSPRTAPPTAGKLVYKPLFAKADVIGFDSYPIEEWCKPETLDRVWWLQQDLIAQVSGKPTFQWIEAGPMEKCKRYNPTPAIVRAETWLAIAAGARGIGYFPDVWPEDITAEIGQINRDIVALAPALLDLKGARTFSVGQVRVGVRKHEGATYVIAVNPLTKPVKVGIPVGEATGRQVSVWGEGRDATLFGNVIQESFDAYGTHIYVIPPGTAQPAV